MSARLYIEPSDGTNNPNVANVGISLQEYGLAIDSLWWIFIQAFFECIK